MESDLERLVYIRAKHRVESFGEQVKMVLTGWFWGAIGLGLATAGLVASAPVLFILLGRYATGPVVGAIVTIVLLYRLFHHRYKAWWQKKFSEFYEHELLELKMKSGG